MSHRFLEIYNEKVFDLLNIGNERLSIIDNGSDVLVRGLSERRAYKPSDLYSILHEGSESRSIGATEMNQQSSRSHAIFTITICRVSETSGTIRGKIHFVDLAGSERLEKTKATGSRAAEGISINKSLSTLSKVIESLSTHQSHVPYRESSLTRLLKDSLGGNAKTLMLACVSPADSNHSETVNTLRWADQARKIQNRPVVNLDPATAEICKLRRRIAELEEVVAHFDGEPREPREDALLQRKEVERLRRALLESESQLRGTREDLAFLLSRHGDGVEALLQQKETAIRRLQEQLVLQVRVWRAFQESLEVSGSSVGEEVESAGESAGGEEPVSEEDRAALASLAAQESRLTQLLSSRQEMQSLRAQYEERLLQVATQLATLTVVARRGFHAERESGAAMSAGGSGDASDGAGAGDAAAGAASERGCDEASAGVEEGV